jgi:hypothetical protein
VEVVPVIFAALVLGAVAAVGFGVVVAGVQATDRRMRLREPSHHGWADAFARWVLGVYVRQHTHHGPEQDQHDHNRGRR